MRIEIGQIFTQIISFLVMFWVLKRYAWKPLLSILHERKNKIQCEFDKIKAEKEEIKRLKVEYHKRLNDIDLLAKAKMQEAINEGKHIASEIQQEAHAKAKAIISLAHADLQGEVYKAKDQLKNEIINITMAATEKVLSMKISDDKQKDLMADLIKNM